jgi:FAD/FMN-containing dehydrogenase
MMALGTAEQLAAALEGFSGTLIRPGDSDYNDARRVYNGMIDKRPALIAQCRGTADVVDAVNLARDGGFEVSIRGGGHSVAGLSVTEGGVMIDLSLMRGVHADPVGRTAHVQGGVNWAELNRETQLHGLGVTGGLISTTGIAGLTLGGGLGWTMGKFGLATDNLVSAEVVTADGRVLTATDEENPDLFWGLRGGGGNFGVVTSFQYRLHDIGPLVTGGLVVHPYEAAREVLRFFRDFTSDVPDELTVFAGVLHAPDGSGQKLAGMVICHVGPREQAERDVQPILDFGSPVMTEVGPMPYTAVNAMLDGAYPTGSLNYWKSSFFAELSDSAIDTIVERFTTAPSPMSALLIENFHGEVTRVPVDATACPHRQPGYNFIGTSVWVDAATNDENVGWTRETFAALEPFLADRRYFNYFSEDDVGDEAVRRAYGPNYERLVAVKDVYDPTNLFRLNTNVRPSP